MMATAALYPSSADAFRAQGIEYIWHMTHIAHLDSIKRTGLLSHNAVRRLGYLKQNISDPDVQTRRAANEPVYGRSMHDYVPFFVNPKNAMLFTLRASQRDVCILGVSINVLDETEHLFTNGNAACRDTVFSNDAADVSALPWDVLRAPGWNQFTDGKRYRAAEVMLPNCVPAGQVNVIHLYDRTHIRQAAGYGVRLVVNSDWYF